MPETLLNCEVIVCAGSGGVGKTTMASTIGVWSAMQGKNVLVLTIDPARRLADALGLESTEIDEPSRVEGLPATGQLSACMIDSQKVFENFIRACSPSPEAAERLLKNRLYQQLSTTLSGSQEFTSLEALLQAKQSGKYDLIILDTPPSQHAIDFLRAPEKIFSLFQKSITQWFIRDNKDVGFLAKMINQGTKTALGALKSVTGTSFIDELSDFFETMAELQEDVGKRSIEVHRLLSGEQTGFVLVTSLDPAKLAEANRFQEDLKFAGANLKMVLVNRARPAEFEPPKASEIDQNLQGTLKKVLTLRQKEQAYFRRQMPSLTELGSQLASGTKLICLPEISRDIVGIEGLIKLEKHFVQATKEDLAQAPPGGSE